MKKLRSILRPLFAGLGLFAIVIVYRGWQEDNKPKEECKQKILSVLKSPSTAQFSNFEKLSNWNMLFDVDAQNSYWAMIRSSYLCKIDQPSCLDLPELYVEKMDVSDRERYSTRWNNCVEARDFYKKWTLSWEHVGVFCDEFVSACEKLKNIEEEIEKNSKERCEDAKKSFEEWLYSEEDVKVFCKE